ncbi:MAG: cupin domain-containing protein [Burkholderiales bacterium]|nr:cupin domain-containing protein [Burkholderiales bacterium]
MKTVQMTQEEVATRTARFDKLQAMSTLKDNPIVPQAAKDIFLARKIMPIVLEQTQNAFGNAAAIFGAAGLTMNISVCPPGQGPGLHAHHKTYETFFVLKGSFEFYVNDDGGQKVTLNQWDTFSVPPGVCRGFRNTAAEDSVLLTVITGGVHDRNDISLPPSIGQAIDAYGPGVLDEVKKIGLTFDAGVETAA